MKQICLYFEIHQPVHLKRYRFFDIGKDHYYYDDYENERAIRDTADNSYVPALRTILEMCQQNDNFKPVFALSGVAIEMLEQYAPEVIDLLQQIADMTYTEDGVLHAASIRTNPHAIFILNLQEDLVCRLCGRMEWRYRIAQ